MMRILCFISPVLILLCVSTAQVAPVRSSANLDDQSNSKFVSFDFPGAVDTRGYGINNKGEIVGSYDEGDFEATGFYMDAEGRFRSRDPFNTGYSEAYGINDAGVIVGTFQLEPQDGFAFSEGHYHGFGVGVAFTLPSGVNSLQDIVGGYADVCCNFHGFFKHHRLVSSIDYPGAERTVADGINDAGVIVGTYRDSSFVLHGFKLDRGTFTTIDVPNAAGTAALGINNRGSISGTYFDANNGSHGFILPENGIFRIIDVPGAAGTEVGATNDFDMMVGDYTDINGVQHGFFGYH